MKEFEEIDKNGFCVLPQILDKNLLCKIRAKTLKAFENQEDKDILKPNRRNLFLTIEEILDIIDIPEVDKLCKLFCGEFYKVDHVFFIKGIERSKTKNGVIDIGDFHGGIHSDSGANFYAEGAPKANIARTGRFNIGIPMTPTNLERGGPQLIPGTHKASFYENQWDFNIKKIVKSKVDKIVIPEMIPGDLFCFVDSAIHGTSRHLGDRLMAYLMITPPFVQLMDYRTSAKAYYDLAQTKHHKIRFSPAFHIKISKESGGQANRERFFNEGLS
jgi:hypothetical protein